MSSKTYTPEQTEQAVNLDGFLDPAELNAHIAFIVERGNYCEQYVAYGNRKARAMECRLMGLIEEACQHEQACDAIYRRIHTDWRW